MKSGCWPHHELRATGGQLDVVFISAGCPSTFGATKSWNTVGGPNWQTPLPSAGNMPWTQVSHFGRPLAARATGLVLCWLMRIPHRSAQEERQEIEGNSEPADMRAVPDVRARPTAPEGCTERQKERGDQKNQADVAHC